MRLSEDKQSLEALKQRAADWHIPLVDIQSGTLVPFSNLTSAHGSLAQGGASAGFKLDYAGRSYFVEDLYCPTPECDCRTVHLLFMACTVNAAGEALIEDLFTVRRPLQAAQGSVSELLDSDAAQAERLLRAWEAEHADIAGSLAERYALVRETARRCLDAWKNKTERPAG